MFYNFVAKFNRAQAHNNATMDEATKLFTEIKAALERIERNTQLAAKSVLTLEDAAIITGLSKATIYKLTSSNEIPYYRPGGKCIYFDRAELEQWLKRNRVPTAAEVETAAANYVTHKTA